MPVESEPKKKWPLVVAGGVAAAAIIGVLAFTLGGGDDGGDGGDIPELEGDDVAGLVQAGDGQAIATRLGADTSAVHRTPFSIFTAPEVAAGNVERLGTRNDAEIFLDYDDDALFVTAGVVDDRHDQRNTGNQIFRGDAVNINLALGGVGGSAPSAPDERTFQITMSPGDPAAGTSSGSVIFQGNGSAFATDRTGQVEISADVFADGYTLQGRIPWAVLGLSGPPDAPIGAILTIFDNDGEEANGTPLQTEIVANTPGAGFQQPQTWGRLSFE